MRKLDPGRLQERLIEPGSGQGAAVDGLGDGAEAQRLGVVGGRAHLAVGELELGGVAFEQHARGGGQMLLDLPAGLHGRRSAGGQGAAGEAAEAVRAGVGVALDDGDPLGADAELPGHEMGDGGLVAGSRADDAGQDADRAGGADPHRGGVETADEAACEVTALRGEFEGQADAEVPTKPPRLVPSRFQVVVAREIEDLVQGACVLAGVEVLGRGPVREGFRRYEVAPPHVGRVEAEVLGDKIHHPFEDDGGLLLSRSRGSRSKGPCS